MKKFFMKYLLFLSIINTSYIICSAQTENFYENSIQIKQLQKLGYSNDYYIQLHPLKPYDSIWINLKNILMDTISYKEYQIPMDYTARILLNKDSVSKYFYTKGIDTLIVFNKKQEIIDTLYRKNFERYDVVSRYSDFYVNFISSYSSLKDLSGDIIISSMEYNKLSHKKTPTFKKDSIYIQNIITKNGFLADTIFNAGYIINKKDTICYISFRDNEVGINFMYLLKNRIPTDVKMYEFNPIELIPIPIAKKNEIFYLIHFFNLPDEYAKKGYDTTDLIHIDLRTIKFISYNNNMIHY